MLRDGTHHCYGINTIQLSTQKENSDYLRLILVHIQIQYSYLSKKYVF